jgi:signal transduction histidine kinase/integral membrane sensor domain MASE1/ActR/RegA family two-component response regulator
LVQDHVRSGVLFALLYFGCAAASGFLTHWTNAVSYVWLPSGLFLGILLITPFARWPALVIASAVTDQLFNLLWDPWPVHLTLIAHAGNSVSAMLGAFLIRRLIAERPTLSSVRELLGLVILGGMAGLVPTALVGAKLIEVTSPGSGFKENFIAWYASDLLGVILLAPAVLVWQNGLGRPTEWKLNRRTWEYAALVVLLAIATGSAFYFGWLRQTETLYVAFPFTIWAAVRFGLRGTTVAILLTTIGAEIFTAFGYGALGASGLSASQKSIEMMVSMGVFAVVALLPATVFSALKRAQGRETIRTRIMTLIATGAKLPETLEAIVTGIESENPAMRCSILLVDPAGERLRLASAPSLPAFFNEQIDGLAIAPDAFVCGVAAHNNALVVVEDVQRDPRTTQYRRLAEQTGIGACWSQPFSDSSGRMLGTFAVYYREARSPSAEDLKLIISASHLAAIATERKQLEEQFLRAQRMEGIGTLAGGIAHDLNNVFTPIIMGAQLLKEGPIDLDAKPVLTNIEKSARRGATLVRQVLTFARGVAGSREALSIESIVTDWEAIAGNTFPKNILVTRNIPRALPPIRGDRTQIEQVLMNLCVNARDAMPDGGKLSITGRLRRVDAQQARGHPGVEPGDFVELEVADTGVGMNADLLHRIFEPFFTTKKTGQGTGLGLSTALGIVRSHGGFVEVKSVPGAGSSFRVFLPATTMSVAKPVALAEERRLARGNGELVLLVDDEPAIRSTVTRALKELGYKVIEAENGLEGLKQAQRNRASIAVVVTDLTMPVMDGHEFAAKLEQLAPEIPVITASGFDAASKKHAATKGKYPHLAKPYTIDAVAELLASTLKTRRAT